MMLPDLAKSGISACFDAHTHPAVNPVSAAMPTANMPPCFKLPNNPA
jgi:hypothetical protein